MIIYKPLTVEEFDKFQTNNYKFFVVHGVRQREVISMKQALDSLIMDYYLWYPCREETKEKRWWHKKQRVEIFPYFFNYVFLIIPECSPEVVRCIESQKKWWNLLKSEIISLTEKSGEGTSYAYVIPYEQMRVMIETLIDYDKNFNNKCFEIGSVVRIKEGPLFNIAGRVLSDVDSKRVSLEISLFKRQIQVCVDKNNLENL